MKKILVLLLALVMCVAALTACGGNTGNGGNGGDVTYDLTKASAYVKNTHNNYFKEATPSDYEVDSVVTIAGVKYDVTWSVNVDEAQVKVVQGSGATKTVIDVNEKTDADIVYTLTATITAGDGTTAKVEFSHTVPEYVLFTYDEYMAAKKDDVVTVEGIVVAINSKDAGSKRNHLFLADASGKGGYYSYQMDADPIKDLGIEVGMTVSVTGPISPYGGMQEISGGVATILSREKTTYNPVDITDVVKNGGSLIDYVALPVTIKGVTIGTQELKVETSQYLNFTIGNFSSYIRTYLTDLPHPLNAESKATIDAAHAEKFGWTANVTGILIFFNADTPYLIPTSVDCFEYLEYVEKTAEEKIATELNELTFSGSFNADEVVNLLTAGQYYSDVTLTWESDSDYAVVGDGTLTVTVPDAATTINLTVTATCDGKSDTKTFAVKLAKGPMAIADAIQLADGSPVIIAGTVTSIKDAWSDQYGNISVYVSDGETTILVFRLKTKVVVGDVITVTGTMGSYGGSKQIAAGATAEITDPAPVEVTLAEAVTLDDGVRVIVKGTVKTINTAWSDQYGNITVTITDGTNDLYIFRLATKVEVGDKVTITGKVGSYNGSKQIAAGATAVIEGENGGDNTPDAPAEVTIADALAAAEGTVVTIKGTVESMYYEWSDQYNNCSPYITDGTNKILVFRTGTKVAVGDQVTVTGTISVYNEVNQIAQGSTVVIDVKAPEGGNDNPGTDNPGTDAPVVTDGIVFEFGANGNAAHVDGTDVAEGTEYTCGDYTLTLTGVSKVYEGSFDAKGNSCLKFGTSKVVGTMSFTVADDVTSVVIKVARYKNYTSNIVINGELTAIGADYQSNDGTYMEITVDTSANKTVTIATDTTDKGQRIMIDSIAFIVE